MKKYFIILFLFTACSSRMKKAEYVFPYDAVEVRASGGVTGIATGFVIQKTGEIQVIYHLPNKSFNQKFYRTTTLDSVKLFFDKLQASNVLTKPYNKPGNLTYSIVARKDSSTSTIYWSDGQDSISNYIEMYRMLRGFASGRLKE